MSNSYIPKNIFNAGSISADEIAANKLNLSGPFTDASTEDAKFNGSLEIYNNGGTKYSSSGTATNSLYTFVKANPVSPITWAFTLPLDAGVNGFILSTDGTGITSWINPNPFNQSLNQADNVKFNNVTVANILTVQGKSNIQDDMTFNTGTFYNSKNKFSTYVCASPSNTSDYVITLPPNPGNPGDVLSSDGTGLLQWINAPSFSSVGVTNGDVVISATHGLDFNAAHGTTFVSASSSTINWSFYLPPNAGAANALLQTDGTGASSWVTALSVTGLTSTGDISIQSAHALSIQGSNYSTKVIAAPATTNWQLTLPANTGNAGQVLSTDGTGVASWINANPFDQSLNTSSSPIFAGITSTADVTIQNSKGLQLANIYLKPSANANAVSWNWTLPYNSGTSNQLLQTNGSGVSTWTSAIVASTISSSGDIDITNGSGLAFVNGSSETYVLANAAATSLTLTLPAGAGSVGQVLSTDGTGITSWINQNPFNQTLNTTSNVTFATVASAGDITTSTGSIKFGTALSLNAGSSSNLTLTLPSSAGSSKQVLQTDGTGVTSWTSTINATSVSSSGNISVTGGYSILLQNSSTQTTTVSSSGMATTWTLTLPANAGTTNQVLSTNGSGVTSWINQNPFDQSLNTTSSVTFASLTSKGDITIQNSGGVQFSNTYLIPSASATKWTWTLPVGAGTTGQVLSTDGTGLSSWINPNPFNQNLNSSNSPSFSALATTVGDITVPGTKGLQIGTSTYIKASTGASGWTFTLPTTAGTAGYVLSTNGSGISSWISAPNPFNQSLNTTSSVQFTGISSTASDVTITGSKGIQFTNTYLIPSASATTWTLTLPTGAGTAGQVLSTDGTGLSSWINANPFNQTLNTTSSPMFATATLSANLSLSSLTATNGIYSSNASSATASRGGVYMSAVNNSMYFTQGTNTDTWGVYDQNGSLQFQVRNTVKSTYNSGTGKWTPALGGSIITTYNTFLDDGTGNIVLAANSNTVGVQSYQAYTSTGGTYSSSSNGSIYFKGGTAATAAVITTSTLGSAANTWNVCDQNGHVIFQVCNTTSGSTGGGRVQTFNQVLDDGGTTGNMTIKGNFTTNNGSVTCASLVVGGTTYARAAISNLVDVTLTSLTAGQILQYNSSGRWVNVTPSSGGGSTTLASLTDVADTSPAQGQYLVYQSGTSKWTNQTLQAAAATSSTISATTGMQAGQIMYNSDINQLVQYNGSAWSPVLDSQAFSKARTYTGTAAFTMATTDYVVNVNSTTPITITLPPVSSFVGISKRYIIVNLSANAITIVTQGSDHIDNTLTSYTISNQFDRIEFVSNADSTYPLWMSV